MMTVAAGVRGFESLRIPGQTISFQQLLDRLASVTANLHALRHSDDGCVFDLASLEVLEDELRRLHQALATFAGVDD